MNTLVYRKVLTLIPKTNVSSIQLCRRKLVTLKPHNRIAKVQCPQPHILLTPVSALIGPTPARRGSTRHLEAVGTEAVAVKKRKMTKLTESERAEKLQPLLKAGWTLVAERDAIYKEYEFVDFVQAFSFMTAVALFSEKANHHPEWFNVYNKVQITMSTHDVGGLSAKDIKAATLMDAEAKRFL